VGGPFKILVADRNLLVVEALRDMFAELNNGICVLTANSLQDAIDVAQHEKPELIVVDAWIGSTDAGTVIRQVLEASPASAVFVMATTCDDDFAARMRRSGASGCCEKELIPASARAILDTVGGKR
jgi:DNA-binding NarL/FixJ family response regulator